ncbi:FixH family protein [Bacillus atrophaeus]|uniref:FixH family protein n=1 Tax=Bacillus atrophaeus TaxID=1452 RepID=UPI0012395751|nr:FixH family protein [Bacillus atrophaeus]
MKRGLSFCFLIIFMLLLTSCTVDPNAADQYVQSKQLDVEMILSSSLSKNKEQELKIKLTQEGIKVENATNVKFEIWKENHQEHSEVVKARYDNNGTYVAKKTFTDDGLYNIKADVKTRDLHVMPTRQVIVGKLSEEEKNALKTNDEKHEGHHSHH